MLHHVIKSETPFSKLIIGPHPYMINSKVSPTQKTMFQNVKKLIDLGVRHFVSLQITNELYLDEQNNNTNYFQMAQQLKNGVTYYNLPIKTEYIVSDRVMEEYVDQIIKIMNSPEPFGLASPGVYIHSSCLTPTIDTRQISADSYNLLDRVTSIAAILYGKINKLNTRDTFTELAKIMDSTVLQDSINEVQMKQVNRILK
jgi:hypothetical protein